CSGEGADPDRVPAMSGTRRQTGLRISKIPSGHADLTRQEGGGPGHRTSPGRSDVVSGNRSSKAFGWSESEPTRKWIVWVDGVKKKDAVVARDAEGAVTAARSRWRIPPSVVVDVKPQFPTRRDLQGTGAGTDLQPSTPHDAHVVRIALVTLGWTRQKLCAR